jgi:hypothetical protein
MFFGAMTGAVSQGSDADMSAVAWRDGLRPERIRQTSDTHLYR